MASAKTRLIYGVLVKKETTYGTYTAPAVGTDGVSVAEYPVATLSYGVDGARGPAPGNHGTLRRTPPAAPIVTAPLKLEARGTGAAYSASVYPPEHVLLQAAGMDATIVTTPGSETITYTRTPGPGSFSSASIDFYTEGEKWPLNGCYATWEYEVENGKPAMWTYEVRGRLNADPSADVATAKTITYEAEVPPIAAPLAITFDAVSSIPVSRIRVTGQRQLSDRIRGQWGFHPGRTEPQLSFLIEKPLLTTYDFFAEWKNGTANAASFQVGTVQYNRHIWTFAQTQVINVAPQNESESALIEVTCSLHDSTQILNDAWSLLYS